MKRALFAMLLASCSHVHQKNCEEFVGNIHTTATAEGYTLIVAREFPVPLLTTAPQVAIYLHADQTRGIVYYLLPAKLESLEKEVIADHFETVGTCSGLDQDITVYKRSIVAKIKGDGA